MGSDLPIIESCEGCGACCMTQESPPAYVMLISQPQLGKDALFKRDANRLAHLPKAARQELDDYIERLQANPREGADRPCIWLDLESRQCRWYEHRPTICREGLERGDEGCRAWRADHGIASTEEREALIADALRHALGKDR